MSNLPRPGVSLGEEHSFGDLSMGCLVPKERAVCSLCRENDLKAQKAKEEKAAIREILHGKESP